MKVSLGVELATASNRMKTFNWQFSKIWASFGYRLPKWNTTMFVCREHQTSIKPLMTRILRINISTVGSRQTSNFDILRQRRKILQEAKQRNSNRSHTCVNFFSLNICKCIYFLIFLFLEYIQSQNLQQV